jgi:hypothetical protein
MRRHVIGIGIGAVVLVAAAGVRALQHLFLGPLAPFAVGRLSFGTLRGDYAGRLQGAGAGNAQCRSLNEEGAKDQGTNPAKQS